jgi:hypothetical protein
MFQYVIIVVVLIILLTWIYLGYATNSDKNYRSQKIKETVNWLYQTINDICYQCNMSPIYDIRETSQITYTEKTTQAHSIKGIIYLVIWDAENNKVFNKNTLLYAMIHEITHILSPSIHHQPPIESLLLTTATNLGYYDRNIPMESHYITLDINYAS